MSWGWAACASCGRETYVDRGLCGDCRLILELTDRQVQAVCDRIECARIEQDLLRAEES